MSVGLQAKHYRQSCDVRVKQSSGSKGIPVELALLSDYRMSRLYPRGTWGAEAALATVHVRNPPLHRMKSLLHRAHSLHRGHVAPVHRALPGITRENRGMV